MNQVLSVGAVIDTPTPAAWISQLLERLAQHERLELFVVRQNRSAIVPDTTDAPTSALETLTRHILHRRIDKPLFTQNPWQTGPLTSHPGIRMTTTLPDCDVVLNLTAGPVPTDVLPTSDTPIWDAHVETLDARVEEALLTQAPLLWIHLWNHQRVGCQRLASHALPRQTFSLSDLRRTAWCCLPSLFESRLNWLSQGVDPRVNEYTEAVPAKTPAVDSERHRAHDRADAMSACHFLPTRLPAHSRLLQALQLWYQQSAARISRRVWYEQWQLAYARHSADAQRVTSASAAKNSTGSRPDTGGEFSELPTNAETATIALLTDHALSDYTSIDMPHNTWWADPHLYRHAGSLYVFFEEMGIDDSYGHLSVARLTDTGVATDIETILDEGTHLSYPFVFGVGEEVYMIPETVSRRAVQLYKADAFPTRWSRVCNLLDDVDLADSTVYFDGQRWWMFTSAMSHRTVNERDELHLFHAESLTGTWQPHPMNPVVTGVDRARMGGALIHDGTHLCRVSQYGAVRYGYGINLHRVTRLDADGYAEVTIGRILPQRGSRWLGCHTIAHTNDITVLDRVVRRRRRHH